MNIQVQLYLDLAKYLPPGSRTKKVRVTLQEESSIQGLIEHLGLPPQVAKIILVNGIKPKNGAKLKDGDVVAIFPPMAGG